MNQEFPTLLTLPISHLRTIITRARCPAKPIRKTATSGKKRSTALTASWLARRLSCTEAEAAALITLGLSGDEGFDITDMGLDEDDDS